MAIDADNIPLAIQILEFNIVAAHYEYTIACKMCVGLQWFYSRHVESAHRPKSYASSSEASS